MRGESDTAAELPESALAGPVSRALGVVYDAAAALAAICLAGIALVMLAQAASRQFGWNLVGGDDIAAWSCAAAAFLGLAHTQRHGELIRMELLLDALPVRLRQLAERLAFCIATASVGYAAVAMTVFVYRNARDNEVSQGLIIVPLWIPQSTAALGLILLFAAFSEDLVRVMRGRKPAFMAAQEARRAAKDFSEAL